MKKYPYSFFVLLFMMLTGCTLTYNGQEIVEKANDARTNKSSCNKLKDASIPILFEQGIGITYFTIVGIEEVKDINYEPGRMRIKLHLAFCDNLPFGMDYAQEFKTFVISGAPELRKTEKGKEIFLNNVFMANTFNCYTFGEPFQTLCLKGDNVITGLMNAIISIFSNDVPICRFTGISAYLVDKIEVIDGSIKVKWSLF
jgi:hypothetical protein